MNLTCAICSELFLPSDDIRITPCGHAFHYTCVLQWFGRSQTCPQCRNRCVEKTLIRFYLNVAATPVEDSTTLQDRLDTATLSLREKEKKLKEFEEKDASYKSERKKMKKTLLALEDKVKSKDFTISVYEQEVEMLRGYRDQAHKQQTELAELKKKLQLMSTVEYAISATANEVEEMLNRNEDPQTLAVLAATFKRELKYCEAKKQEIRDRMKSIQNELSEERSQRKSLEDKLSFADSEMYRLEQEVKRLEKNNPANSDDTESDIMAHLTPDHSTKRKRVDVDMNKSTPMSEKVEKILQSDSPYFNIKSCSIGLVPLIRPGLSASARFGKGSTETKRSVSTKNDLSKEISILRKPRLARNYSMPLNPNLVYNGLGGSEKKENFPGFPEPKQSTSTSHTVKRIAKTSSSISARLKSGQLKKPAKQCVDPNEIFEFLDIPLDD